MTSQPDIISSELRDQIPPVAWPTFNNLLQHANTTSKLTGTLEFIDEDGSAALCIQGTAENIAVIQDLKAQIHEALDKPHKPVRLQMRHTDQAMRDAMRTNKEKKLAQIASGRERSGARKPADKPAAPKAAHDSRESAA